MRQIGRDPIFIERGEGCELVDVDGNRYVDWVCSWGPLILGHADPDVVAAVSAAAARGTSFGAATEAEVELAEEVVGADSLGRDGADDQLRDRGGDERGPARPRGHRPRDGRQVRRRLPRPLDGLLAEAGSGLATLGDPGEPGRHRGPGRRTPSSSPGTTARRSRGRSTSTRSRRSSPSRSPANMGVVPPGEGFLEFLREATARRAARCSSSTR